MAREYACQFGLGCGASSYGQVIWHYLGRLVDAVFWSRYQDAIGSTVKLFFSRLLLYFVCWWWQMSNIIRYVNSWIIFTTEFEFLTGTTISSFSTWFPSCILVFGLVFVILIVTMDQLYLQDHFEPWMLFPYFNSYYYLILVTFFFILHFIYIAHAARSLRMSFFKVLEQSPYPDVVHGYRQLWLQLRQRLLSLNSAFSPMLLLIMWTQTFYIVVSAYSALGDMCEGHFARAKNYVCILLWAGATVTLLCETSSYVTREIENVIDTLAKNDVKIDPSGLLELDKSLLLQIGVRLSVALLVLILRADMRQTVETMNN